MIIIKVGKDEDVFVVKDEEDLDEQDRASLPDRIKSAIEEYGTICINRGVAEVYFNANWNDFIEAIKHIISEGGYKLDSFIKKEEDT